jgi:predicted metalloprotease with PDZ domain
MVKPLHVLVAMCTLVSFFGLFEQAEAGGTRPAAPCGAMNDACFEGLEREYESRGGIGAAFRGNRDPKGPMYIVERVVPGGPAEAAGLEPGDGVMAINGHRLVRAEKAEAERSAELFNLTLLELRRGERISFTVVRNGQERVVEVVAGPRSPEAARSGLLKMLTVVHGREWADAYSAYLARKDPPPSE